MKTIIKSIYILKRIRKVKISFLDNNFIYLDIDVFSLSRVQQNQELDISYINQLLTDSIKKTLKESVFNFLSYKPRSSFEIKELLIRKFDKIQEYFHSPYEELNIDKSGLINQIIDELTNRKYLDDEKFSKNLIGNMLASKKMGQNIIKQKLFKKGISIETITKTLNNKSILNSDNNKENIKYSLNSNWQKIKNRHYDKYKAKKILTQRMLYRGFIYDEFRSEIDELLETEYNN